MKIKSLIYFTLFALVVLISSACNQTRYVPTGNYLLKENNIKIIGEELDIYTVESVIKQSPNNKTLGVKVKLWAYNRVDSAAVAQKRIRKNQKLQLDNDKIARKEERINKKRMRAAIENNEAYYREKRLNLKDTLNPRKFFREWLKYEFGEAPVVYSQEATLRTVEQLEIYLKKKGFYFGTVSFQEKLKKNKKAVLNYTLTTGKPYVVDSVYVMCDNRTVFNEYKLFLTKEESALTPPFRFDTDLLDQQRDAFTKHATNRTLYGFRKKYIRYEAFTDSVNLTVKLGIRISDRIIPNPNNPSETIEKPFGTFRIRNVYFHIADTSSFEGNFKSTMRDLGLNLTNNGYLQTIDTLFFNDYHPVDGIHDSIFRQAYFLYNRTLPIAPSLIEFCNFLENENVYKAYYVERSFQRLTQLGLFQTIKPVVEEIEGKYELDVHYYLIPNNKQSFGFEPRATNSNGFLGVSASINYKNKNVFKKGEKLTISFSGGFESQPAVFDETVDGEQIESAGRSFNTIEYGPSIKLELPGILPFVNFTKLSKRHYPSTILSAAYNFQRRSDFNRQLIQFNYGYKFNSAKGDQVFQLGLPLLSSIQFVKLDKDALFEERLMELNDLFLLNTYSDQFIWKDFRATFEYSNKKFQKGDFLFYYDAEFDVAGLVLQALTANQTETIEGYKTFLGVRYSEFVRLDNSVKLYHDLKKKRSLNCRISFGAGLPFNNNATSLPFDYAFFTGGANDNRGWRARALGPGSYKYYLDTNRTATQIGDIRIGGNVEYRFNLGGYFRGAFFVDASNIWTINEDANRPGSQFSSSWYNEFGIASGFGLRMDIDFFVVRLDLGIPLRNPALPENARWIFQDRQPYLNEGFETFGTNYESILPRPFIPQIHLGIGFPF
ncbi:MAG: BamA/TamA family outer membrane protein [Lishizhenia sp.]